MEKELLIRVVDIYKTYQMGEVRIHALRGINLDIYKGDFIAVMGASGSGKSTLMNILGCLDRPSKGKYFFDNVDTSGNSNTELARIRRNNVGFVFQAYNLLSRTTAYDNVELPLLYSKKYKSSKRKELVLNALESVGLKDRMNSKPNQLSGGQQQRVAIARSIVNNPAVIYADEPTGNLDSHTSLEIMAIFQELNQHGTTIVLVTHESDVADFCKSKVVFRDGKIITSKINDNQKNALEELAKLPAIDDIGEDEI